MAVTEAEHAASHLSFALAEDAAPRQGFAARNRKLLLGLLAVALFIAAWQAIFLVVPFNKLFIS